MTDQTSQLDEEIESWKGFPWALRKEDLELWNAMVKEVKDRFEEVVEKSGKTFPTDPFFMALLLVQQGMIKRLQRELRELGVDSQLPESMCLMKLVDFLDVVPEHQASPATPSQ
jgi:hypothetical protein